MIKRLLLLFLLTVFFVHSSVHAEEASIPGRRFPPVAPKEQMRRAEMKANIKGMRDERKKLVVENVQKKLTDVNARRTGHFTNVLDRLFSILDKIQTRTVKAKGEGKDVSAIESAIAAARAAIATAESAVNAQKGKTYQITVSDENAAKAEVGATVKMLHTDLQAVHDTIQAARKAVVKVFEQVKSVI